MLLPNWLRCNPGYFLPLQFEPFLLRWLRLGIHSVSWNCCNFESVHPLYQKGTYSFTSGWINRNIHISLYCKSSHFKDFFDSLLDFHVLWTERTQSLTFEQYITVVRRLLVYDIPDHSFIHHGWFHVLLGQGNKKRWGCDPSNIYLINISVICS